jgi:type II secretory pathway predicted ATPase ExeA
VIGPSGVGKTLLCQMLAEQLRDSFQVVLLSCGRLSTRRALLQAILYELGQRYRGMDEGELRLALVDYLTSDDNSAHGMVLLIDEAHTLPLRLLDEIRLLTNLVREGNPRIRLALAGNPLLEERFASPKLESFSQRVVARCYLEPFTRAETQQYVERQTGGGEDSVAPVFSTEACRAVHQATDGVPRLVNQLCDHAMVLAYSDGQKRVNTASIEEAWADLQQLPTPYAGGEEVAAGAVIEFGGLDDEADDLASDTRPRQDHGELPQARPALRVAPMSEGMGGDLAGQLNLIESTLAEIDEDFEPAGSIRPEVELVFENIGNPFDEPFEHEEVVTDRFPNVVLAQWPAATAAEGGQPTEVAAVARPAAYAPEGSEALPQETSSRARQVGPETVPLRRERATSRVGPTPQEEELILIEDGYEEGDVPPAKSIPVVHRQEYGQLFARLRRSS